MVRLRIVFALAAALFAAGAPAQQPAPADPAGMARVLSMMQVVMQAANAGADPQAAQQVMEDILAGRNAEANALMRDLFGELPAAERDKVMAIGRSILAMSQKQAAIQSREAGEAAALQARKDLAAMGLAYHDPRQYLDAVRRGDVLAVRLFLTGRGVPANASDAAGSSALDLARKGGNEEMIAIVAAAATGARP